MFIDNSLLSPNDFNNLFIKKKDNLKLFVLTNCYSYEFYLNLNNLLNNSIYLLSTNSKKQAGFDSDILKSFSKFICNNLLNNKRIKFKDITYWDLNKYMFISSKRLSIFVLKDIEIKSFFNLEPVPSKQLINSILPSFFTNVFLYGGNNKKQYLFKLYNCRIKIKNGEIYASTAKEAGNIIGKNIVKYSNKNNIKFTILCLNNNKFYSFKIKNNT